MSALARARNMVTKTLYLLRRSHGCCQRLEKQSSAMDSNQTHAKVCFQLLDLCDLVVL